MLSKWKAHLVSLRSRKTVDAYVGAVTDFMKFCYQSGHDAMRLDSVQEYVDHLSSRIAPRSVHQYASGIRKFFKFQGQELGKLELPRIPRRKPRHLDEKQLEEFFEEVARVRSPVTRTVLSLLPLTGLRIKREMLELEPGHIEQRHDGAWLRFPGKGPKDPSKYRVSRDRGEPREVPLSRRAASILKEYMDNHWDGTRKLFPVSYQAVNQRLILIREHMGLPWLTPHVLRHTFATVLRDKNVSLGDIQELLGHADLKTTMIYSHPTSTSKRRAIRQGGL